MVRNPRLRRFSLCGTYLALLTLLGPLKAQAIDWPQEIKTSEGNIVVYQPQPESLKGNMLTGRAAVSLELPGRPEPIFGAFWFAAKVDTDKETDTATVRDVKVTQVRWPDAKDADGQKFTRYVEASVPKAGFVISMERLSASLASAALEQKSLESIKNEPPVIVFSEQLAVLLSYDGEPRFVAVEQSNYERALNTPFAVARDKQTKRVYLSSGALWYEAGDPKGPWTQTQSPPADLVKMLTPPAGTPQDPAPDKVPAIVVATTPTELVVTDGKPNWTSLVGGKILYVKNTETAWLRETSGTSMYVLLSGRWYSAASTAGPWTFVRADKLPPSFKEIPPDSDIGGLRVSVAGTNEANDAMLDAQIPQTAAIKRSEAKLEVHYDGEPKFEKVTGTAVEYGVNTATQVLKINGRYYAVDNGVWFTSAGAKGPWTVADKIPNEEIQKIPPSSPVYNTTYVEIYDSTPDVVYVGYTPGYMWSFPYYGVPIYGTGWYYPPYWGAIYYPRPPTWGFHVGYNPWTGWNYGMSWSNGFISIGIAWGGGYPYRPPYCCGGWYGGGYHRPPYVSHHGNINIGNTINIGNNNNFRNTISQQPSINTRDINNRNLYNRPESSGRVANRPTASQNLGQATPTTRQNDVFADKSGNVAKRNGDNWQTRDQGSWNSDRAAPAQRDIDHGDLNRAYESRQSGASRERSRPAQMPRGGGGGRRR